MITSKKLSIKSNDENYYDEGSWQTKFKFEDEQFYRIPWNLISYLISVTCCVSKLLLCLLYRSCNICTCAQANDEFWILNKYQMPGNKFWTAKNYNFKKLEVEIKNKIDSTCFGLSIKALGYYWLQILFFKIAIRVFNGQKWWNFKIRFLAWFRRTKYF